MNLLICAGNEVTVAGKKMRGQIQEIYNARIYYVKN